MRQAWPHARAFFHQPSSMIPKKDIQRMNWNRKPCSWDRHLTSPSDGRECTPETFWFKVEHSTDWANSPLKKLPMRIGLCDLRKHMPVYSTWLENIYKRLNLHHCKQSTTANVNKNTFTNLWDHHYKSFPAATKVRKYNSYGVPLNLIVALLTANSET